MHLRSVAVLGGGPGGLYAARLLRLRHPGCRVDVYEQSSPAETFGFGVGLATRTQRNLKAADPASLDEIVRFAWSHDMGMGVGGRTVRLPLGNLIAIGRATLLDVLRTHAESAGAHVHHGTRRTAADLDADLVIAADGVSSATRAAAPAVFGAHVVTHADGLYLWAGTDFALPSALFRPERTEFGTFVTHAYPYQADRSTFLVETDPQTWHLAGFDASTERTPADGNDDESLAYLSRVFADDLEGHPLIGNRTRWLRFRTVRCDTWHAGNVVLLGDAAHTAHYSIGSGTKLAMEDAIALDQALADAGDLEEGLRRYEEVRRPAVEHLQDTAERSMRWWDSFSTRLDQPVEQLLVAYMSRAGKVSVDRFAELAPDVVRQGLAAYAACEPADVPDTDRVAWILSRPVSVAGREWPTRVADSADLPAFTVSGTAGIEADALVAAVKERGCELVALTGASAVSDVLDVFEVGERVRRETGAAVVARVGREHTELAAAALASGRIDLVDLVVWST